MSHSFYNYMALLEPDSDADLNKLADRLQKRFAASKALIQVQPGKEQLTVTIDEYVFTIYASDSAHVIAESKELADAFKEDYAGNPVERDNVASCARRFEVSGAADYEMNYFNESLFILECIETFNGVIILGMD